MSSDIYPEGLALRHWPGWLGAEKANAYLEQLLKEVPWKQEQIKLFGRQHPLPRLTCWMADPGCGYCYSGLENVVESWTPTAQTIREQVTKAAASPFNSLLLNYYRTGVDAMGWHADDELELDPDASIASLSLGASRSFRFKAKTNSKINFSLELHHGDLLLMDPPTQDGWLHALPKRLRVQTARLNLTFRVVRN